MRRRRETEHHKFSFNSNRSSDVHPLARSFAASRIALVFGLGMSCGAALAQTSPGEAVFQSSCVNCHVQADTASRLQATWVGKKADELYQRIKTTMPAEQPGSLTDAQYIATGHILNWTEMGSTGPTTQVQQLASITIIAPKTNTAPKLPNVEWRDFNGNLTAQRYSPLDQINAGNANKLAIAWRWPAGMFGPNPELKNVCPCTAKGVDRFIRG
jgi:mono/diheme cytochrome c family protein